MNTMQREYISMQNVVDRLAQAIRPRRDTFKICDFMVECDLGGTFMPVCGEMYTFAAANYDANGSRFDRKPGIPAGMSQGESHEFSSAAHRCYYEFLRSGTGIKQLFIRIRARGMLELTVMAQNTLITKTIQHVLLDFGPEARELTMPLLDLVNLPPNGSLYLQCRGIAESNIVFDFRWIGLMSEEQANMGERIYLIRTFGCKAAVQNAIRTITNKLAKTHTDILKRSLFVVYDASSEPSPQKIGQSTPGCRILEMSGPNCGGGGNASLLVSMILRLPENILSHVSELILMDDDARIDPETIIRHDGFVTARKSGIISTAVVYKSDSPLTIQEYGGIWGKFFSKANHLVDIKPEESTRTMFPYLPRSNRDLSKFDDCLYLGSIQEVDYATFIFISFPCQLLREIGAPFPFFLRNDDVEICLRAQAAAGKVMVNPNLQAWHAMSQTIVSEFYAVLHGLILNHAYGWMSREYFFMTMMDRVACQAKVGNAALLYAYALALEYFAQGPDWMSPPNVFKKYQGVHKAIKNFCTKYLYMIPNEVVEVNRNTTDVFNIVENFPPVPLKKNVVFFDKIHGIHYGQRIGEAQPAMEEMLESVIASLDAIANNYDEISRAWKEYLRGFSHVDFWDAMFERPELALEFERYDPAGQLHPHNVQPPAHMADVDTLKKLSGDGLPMDFSEKSYLEKNPDVAASGIPAKVHWLKYGKNEGRKY